MFRLLVVATFISVAFGASLVPNRGIGQSPIVGGETAVISDAPWQVVLHYDSSASGSYYFRCGGSIIKTNVILTSGYCTSGTTANLWKAIAGTSDFIGLNGTAHIGSKVITHSRYSYVIGDYDIGMIVLASDIPIDNINTRVATLPASEASIATGASALVTGWGSTVPGGSMSYQLQKVTLPVVDQATCVRDNRQYFSVTDRMVCGGGEGASGMSICNGDTGGPFVVDGVLVGVIIWSKQCVSAFYYPVVATRVPSFITWINDNL